MYVLHRHFVNRNRQATDAGDTVRVTDRNQ